jgi:hypothetical protein
MKKKKQEAKKAMEMLIFEILGGVCCSECNGIEEVCWPHKGIFTSGQI